MSVKQVWKTNAFFFLLKLIWWKLQLVIVQTMDRATFSIFAVSQNLKLQLYLWLFQTDTDTGDSFQKSLNKHLLIKYRQTT